MYTNNTEAGGAWGGGLTSSSSLQPPAAANDNSTSTPTNNASKGTDVILPPRPMSPTKATAAAYRPPMSLTLDQHSQAVKKNAEHATLLQVQAKDIARAATPITTRRLDDRDDEFFKRFHVVQTPDVGSPSSKAGGGGAAAGDEQSSMAASSSLSVGRRRGMTVTVRAPDDGKYDGMSPDEILQAKISERAAEAKRKSDERMRNAGGKPVLISSAEIRGGGPAGLGVKGMDNSFGVDPTDHNNRDDEIDFDDIHNAAERKRREILEFRGTATLSEMRAKAAELQELKDRLEKSKCEKEHAAELKFELTEAEEKVEGLIDRLTAITHQLDDCRDDVVGVKERLDIAEEERRVAAEELPKAQRLEEMLAQEEESLREALEVAQLDYERKKAVINEAEARLHALMRGQRRRKGRESKAAVDGGASARRRSSVAATKTTGSDNDEEDFSDYDDGSDTASNASSMVSPNQQRRRQSSGADGSSSVASAAASPFGYRRTSLEVLEERRRSILGKVGADLQPSVEVSDGTSAPSAHRQSLLPPRRSTASASSLTSPVDEVSSPTTPAGERKASKKRGSSTTSSKQKGSTTNKRRAGKSSKRAGGGKAGAASSGDDEDDGAAAVKDGEEDLGTLVIGGVKSSIHHPANKWGSRGTFLDTEADYERLAEAEEGIKAKEAAAVREAEEKALELERIAEEERRKQRKALRRMLGMDENKATTSTSNAGPSQSKRASRASIAVGSPSSPQQEPARGSADASSSAGNPLQPNSYEAGQRSPSSPTAAAGIVVSADSRGNSPTHDGVIGSSSPNAIFRTASTTSTTLSAGFFGRRPSSHLGTGGGGGTSPSSQLFPFPTAGPSGRISRHHTKAYDAFMAQATANAASLVTFTVGGVSGISVGVAQHTLDKQAAKIEQLTRDVDRRKQLSLSTEKELFALRDRFDHLRVELLALRRFISNNEWEAVRDLKAQVKFYQKERVALYTKLYGHVKDFVLPAVTPLYDGLDNTGPSISEPQTPQAVQLPPRRLTNNTYVTNTPPQSQISALDEIRKQMAEQIAAANAEGGHLHTQRIIDRLRMDISNWKIRVENKNAKITAMRERLELVEKEALFGNDLLLRGTDAISRRLELLFHEASLTEKRAVEREAELHDIYGNQLKELEAHISTLENDLKSSTEQVNHAREENYDLSKKVRSLEEQLAEAQATSAKLAAALPEDTFGQIAAAHQLIHQDDLAAVHLIEKTVKMIEPDLTGLPFLLKPSPAASEDAASPSDTLKSIQHSLAHAWEPFLSTTLVNDEVQRYFTNVAVGLKVLAAEHIRDSPTAQRLVQMLGASLYKMVEWWQGNGPQLAYSINAFADRMRAVLVPPKTTRETEAMTDLPMSKITQLLLKEREQRDHFHPDASQTPRNNLNVSASFITSGGGNMSPPMPLSSRRTSMRSHVPSYGIGGADDESSEYGGSGQQPFRYTVETASKGTSAGRGYVGVTYADRSTQHQYLRTKDAGDNTDIALGNSQSLERAAEAFGIGHRDRQERLEEVLRGQIANQALMDEELKAREERLLKRTAVFNHNKYVLRRLMTAAERRMMEVEDHAEALNMKQRKFGDWYSRYSARVDVGTWIPNDLIQLRSTGTHCGLITQEMVDVSSAVARSIAASKQPTAAQIAASLLSGAEAVTPSAMSRTNSMGGGGRRSKSGAQTPSTSSRKRGKHHVLESQSGASSPISPILQHTDSPPCAEAEAQTDALLGTTSQAVDNPRADLIGCGVEAAVGTCELAFEDRCKDAKLQCALDAHVTISETTFVAECETQTDESLTLCSLLPPLLVPPSTVVAEQQAVPATARPARAAMVDAAVGKSADDEATEGDIRFVAAPQGVPSPPSPQSPMVNLSHMGVQTAEAPSCSPATVSSAVGPSPTEECLQPAEGAPNRELPLLLAAVATTSADNAAAHRLAEFHMALLKEELSEATGRIAIMSEYLMGASSSNTNNTGGVANSLSSSIVAPTKAPTAAKDDEDPFDVVARMKSSANNLSASTLSFLQQSSSLLPIPMRLDNIVDLMRFHHKQLGALEARRMAKDRRSASIFALQQRQDAEDTEAYMDAAMAKTERELLVVKQELMDAEDAAEEKEKEFAAGLAAARAKMRLAEDKYNDLLAHFIAEKKDLVEKIEMAEDRISVAEKRTDEAVHDHEAAEREVQRLSALVTSIEALQAKGQQEAKETLEAVTQLIQKSRHEFGASTTSSPEADRVALLSKHAKALAEKQDELDSVKAQYKHSKSELDRLRMGGGGGGSAADKDLLANLKSANETLSFELSTARNALETLQRENADLLSDLSSLQQYRDTHKASLERLEGDKASIMRDKEELIFRHAQHEEDLQLKCDQLVDERERLRREVMGLHSQLAMREDWDSANNGGVLFSARGSSNKSAVATGAGVTPATGQSNHSSTNAHNSLVVDGGRPPRASSAALAHVSSVASPRVATEAQRFAAQIHLVLMHNHLMELLSLVKMAYSLPIPAPDEDDRYGDVRRYFTKHNIEAIVATNLMMNSGGGGTVNNSSSAGVSTAVSPLPTSRVVAASTAAASGGVAVPPLQQQALFDQQQAFTVGPDDFKKLTRLLHRTAENDVQHMIRYIAALRKLGVGGGLRHHRQQQQQQQMRANGAQHLQQFDDYYPYSSSPSPAAARTISNTLIRDDNRTEYDMSRQQQQQPSAGLESRTSSASCISAGMRPPRSGSSKTKQGATRVGGALHTETTATAQQSVSVPIATSSAFDAGLSQQQQQQRSTKQQQRTAAAMGPNLGNRFSLLPPAHPSASGSAAASTTMTITTMRGPSARIGGLSPSASSSTQQQYVQTSDGRLVMAPMTSTGGAIVTSRNKQSLLSTAAADDDSARAPQQRPTTSDAPLPSVHHQTQQTHHQFYGGHNTSSIADYNDIRNEDGADLYDSSPASVCSPAVATAANTGVEPTPFNSLPQRRSDALQNLTNASRYQAPNRPFSGRSGSGGHRRLLAPISSADRQNQTRRLLIMNSGGEGTHGGGGDEQQYGDDGTVDRRLSDGGGCGARRLSGSSLVGGGGGADDASPSAVPAVVGTLQMMDGQEQHQYQSSTTGATTNAAAGKKKKAATHNPSPFTANSPKISAAYMAVMSRRNPQGTIPNVDGSSAHHQHTVVPSTSSSPLARRDGSSPLQHSSSPSSPITMGNNTNNSSSNGKSPIRVLDTSAITVGGLSVSKAAGLNAAGFSMIRSTASGRSTPQQFYSSAIVRNAAVSGGSSSIMGMNASSNAASHHRLSMTAPPPAAPSTPPDGFGGGGSTTAQRAASRAASRSSNNNAMQRSPSAQRHDQTNFLVMRGLSASSRPIDASTNSANGGNGSSTSFGGNMSGGAGGGVFGTPGEGANSSGGGSRAVNDGLPPRVGTSHGPLAGRAHMFLSNRQAQSPLKRGV